MCHPDLPVAPSDSSPATNAGAGQAVVRGAGVKRQEGKRQRPAGLTKGGVEGLRRLARGESLKEIAWELVISPATAHTHAAHVYEKAGISTRAGAALFAMEHGLLN